jgi:hypothetical protein
LQKEEVPETRDIAHIHPLFIGWLIGVLSLWKHQAFSRLALDRPRRTPDDLWIGNIYDNTNKNHPRRELYNGGESFIKLNRAR